MIDKISHLVHDINDEYDYNNPDEKVYIWGYVAAGFPNPDTEAKMYIERDSSVPHGSTHAYIVSGDSMEPYIKDRSFIFVNRNASIEPGDV